MSLPIEWAEKIFSRLQGVYGYGFTSKYATGIHDGVDNGMENAKRVWCDELSGFRTWPEAIKYGLEHLPERAPNAIEFREICRRCPKNDQKPALEHKPTPDEQERAKKASRSALEAIKSERDHLAWAKHPRSQGAHSLAIDGAKKDPRLKKIVKSLVVGGFATEQGKLLKR